MKEFITIDAIHLIGMKLPEAMPVHRSSVIDQTVRNVYC